MKRLKNTIPNGGAPLGEFPILKTLFDDAPKDVIDSFLSTIQQGRNGIIISGVVRTGQDITDGYVYLNGKIIYYPGTNSAGIAVCYLVEGATTEIGGVFADGQTKNYIDQPTVDIVFSEPVSNDFIELQVSDDFSNRLSNLIRNHNVLSSSNYNTLRTSVQEIGDWNMDTTDTISIPLSDFAQSSFTGISRDKVRNISVIIVNDAGDKYTATPYLENSSSTQPGIVVSVNGLNEIELTRITSGDFDSANYNSTSFNRGWVTITYEE